LFVIFEQFSEKLADLDLSRLERPAPRRRHSVDPPGAFPRPLLSRAQVAPPLHAVEQGGKSVPALSL
jgi:hypothetical protein